jgi:hypothetical protein
MMENGFNCEGLNPAVRGRRNTKEEMREGKRAAWIERAAARPLFLRTPTVTLEG